MPFLTGVAAALSLLSVAQPSNAPQASTTIKTSFTVDSRSCPNSAPKQCVNVNFTLPLHVSFFNRSNAGRFHNNDGSPDFPFTLGKWHSCGKSCRALWTKTKTGYVNSIIFGTFNFDTAIAIRGNRCTINVVIFDNRLSISSRVKVNGCSVVERSAS
jgi:hypothetical protein